jgi:hypothetical protein
MNVPNLESAGFGWLVADGKRYDHDLVITIAGAIVPRPKHLSKKYGGWHTVLGPEEIETAIAGNPEILVVGCGHFGVLPIRPETRTLLAQRGVQIETHKIGAALKRYDELAHAGKRIAAVLHITC